MRKAVLLFAASAVVAVVAVSTARADTIDFTTTKAGFAYNNILSWAVLGINNLNVTNGSPAPVGSLTTTIDFAKGGPGLTALQCGSTCTGQENWNGNFAPGQSVLASINSNTGSSEGFIDLTFSQGIGGVGFQIEANDSGKFQGEVKAYDGSTLLGTWFETGDSAPGNDTAIFLGLTDLTGADITSIDIDSFKCAGGQDPNCANGFGINRLLLSVPQSSTPEPASLLLLGSGLGALGFLRRKLASRG
ncbi:MAG TPA: PEP-CTERM sorting domain-containing protein [Terriglobia bacterium]